MRNLYRKARICSGIVALGLLPGCVNRVMHVRSDPPGATVWLNDREIGRTPFDKEFLWYGDYDVVARAEGYQTLKTTREVTAPWWQFVPFDLLTDFLPVQDDETVELKLKPLGPPDPAGTLARGQQLKQQLESSDYTTHRSVLRVTPVPHPAHPTTEPAEEP